MTELYETVNQRRVRCGRCRHEVNQTRMEGGDFDSETGVTYSCADCHAIYGVCRRCGWYMEDGRTCYLCAENPSPLLVPDRRPTLLPNNIRERELERDPAGRAGHWYHPKTDTVISMPMGWRPKNIDDDDAVADEDPEDELTGRKIVIIEGRFAGKIGAITEAGLNDDGQGLRVHVSETGEELPFESFDPYLRFMTEEEIAAADEALKGSQPTGDDAELAQLLKLPQAKLRERADELGLAYKPADTKAILAAMILTALKG